ncbi:hypothetical protein GCM10023087_22720 [Microbacterium rhizosphaerae]
MPTIDAHATRRVGDIEGKRAGDAAVTVFDLGTSPTTREPDAAFPDPSHGSGARSARRTA